MKYLTASCFVVGCLCLAAAVSGVACQGPPPTPEQQAQILDQVAKASTGQELDPQTIAQLAADILRNEGATENTALWITAAANLAASVYNQKYGSQRSKKLAAKVENA